MIQVNNKKKQFNDFVSTDEIKINEYCKNPYLYNDLNKKKLYLNHYTKVQEKQEKEKR